MFRKVLVGYDGTPSSKDALALAQRLADTDHGVITLVCTYPYNLHEPHLDGGAYAEALRKRAEETLAEGNKLVGDGLTTETIALAATSPSQGLSFMAEEGHFDLLILGSTHHGPIGRIILGSTGERLLHAAPCAVAVAPRDFSATEPLRQVGVGYDGTPESENALEAAYELALNKGARVTSFTVETIPLTTNMPGAEFSYAAYGELTHNLAKEAADKAKQKAPTGVVVNSWLLAGDPESAILEKAEGTVDVLIVGSRGYGALKRAFLGSVSTALMRDAPFPVLVVPRGASDERHRSSAEEQTTKNAE